MIRMVIADDESIIREGLKSSFPWHEYGVEIVGTAADGQAAHYLCQQLKPDILFTDIRMPLMDGLELIQHLRDEGQDMRFIIISGIQDFAYARTAIELGVEGYILKPIKISELREIIQSTVINIQLEQTQESTLQRFKENLAVNMPLLREHFLRQLIFSSTLNKVTAQEKFEYFSLPFSADTACQIYVLQIDNYYEVLSRLFNEDHLLLNYGVLNIINELLEASCSGLAFLNTNNEYIVLLGHTKTWASPFETLLDRIFAALMQYFKINVSVGIGGETADATTLLRSYREAKMALKHRFFLGNHAIIYYQDVADIYGYSLENQMDSSKLDTFYKDLLYDIKTGNEILAMQRVKEIFLILNHSPGRDSQYTFAYSTELICNISRWLVDFGENIDSFYAGGTVSILTDIQQDRQTSAALEGRICCIVSDIAKAFKKKQVGRTKGLVETIQKIVESQYWEPLSIVTVAKSVFLTPNYVSSVFKQEMGVTFGEYLTSVRMEKAKVLLGQHEIKIQEVGQMVGFENAAYFSTVFKKQVGISPHQYRGMSGG